MVGFEFNLGLLEPFDLHKQPAIDDSQSEMERSAAQIEQVVWLATAGGVRNLQVKLHENKVTLTGRCRTYYVKQVAQHAAMEAAAGCDLVNLIDVA